MWKRIRVRASAAFVPPLQATRCAPHRCSITTKLPTDVMCVCMSFLSFFSLTQMAATCSHMKQLSLLTSAWCGSFVLNCKSICAHTPVPLKQVVETLRRYRGHIHDLSLLYVDLLPVHLLEFLASEVTWDFAAVRRFHVETDIPHHSRLIHGQYVKVCVDYLHTIVAYVTSFKSTAYIERSGIHPHENLPVTLTHLSLHHQLHETAVRDLAIYYTALRHLDICIDIAHVIHLLPLAPTLHSLCFHLSTDDISASSPDILNNLTFTKALLQCHTIKVYADPTPALFTLCFRAPAVRQVEIDLLSPPYYGMLTRPTGVHTVSNTLETITFTKLIIDNNGLDAFGTWFSATDSNELHTLILNQCVLLDNLTPFIWSSLRSCIKLKRLILQQCSGLERAYDLRVELPGVEIVVDKHHTPVCLS